MEVCSVLRFAKRCCFNSLFSRILGDKRLLIWSQKTELWWKLCAPLESIHVYPYWPKKWHRLGLMLFLWIIGMGIWPQIWQSMTEPNVCLAEFRELRSFIDSWEKGAKGRRGEEREGNQVVSTGGRCVSFGGPCSSYSITLNLLGSIMWVPWTLGVLVFLSVK